MNEGTPEHEWVSLLGGTLYHDKAESFASWSQKCGPDGTLLETLTKLCNFNAKSVQLASRASSRQHLLTGLVDSLMHILYRLPFPGLQ